MKPFLSEIQTRYRFPFIFIIVILSATSVLAVESREEPFSTRLVPRFKTQKTITAAPQAFELSLEAGDFVRLGVRQLRGDVALSAFAGGELLVRTNGKKWIEETERFSLTSEVSTIVEIRVEAATPKDIQGEYELFVSDWRKSVSNDGARVKAERLLNEGDEIRNKEDAASFKQAAELYAKGLSLAEEAQDLELQAELLLGIAATQVNLDENVVALKTLDRAATLAREALLPRVEAEVAYLNGAAHDSLGDRHRALEFLELARKLWKGLDSSFGMGVTLNHMATVSDALGDKRKALELYDEALAIGRNKDVRIIAAIALAGLSKIHEDLGEPQAAIDGYYESLKIAREEGNDRGQAALLSNIGLVYQRMGDPAKALELYRESLPLRRKSGHRSGEVTTLNNMGRSLFDLSRYEEAAKHHEAALLLSREISDKRGEGAALYYLGLHAEREGDAEKSLTYYDASLKLRREVGDPQASTPTLDRICVVRTSQGELEKARLACDEALVFARQSGYQRGEFEVLVHKAALEREEGDLDSAHRSIAAALEIAESVRLKPAAQELRASFFAVVQEAFSEEIEILMAKHLRNAGPRYDIRALEAAERARSRSLLDLLSEARADIRRGVDLAMLEREKQLRDQLVGSVDRESRLLRGKHTPEEAAAASQEVNDLTEQWRQLGAVLRTASPAYSSLTRPEPLKFADLQKLVDDQTVILEYRLGKARSYLWAISDTSVQTHILPGRETIEQAVRSLYSALSVNPERAPPARPKQVELAKMLFAVTDQLAGKRVVIVPDGVLYYLPFAALPSINNRPLVTSHEVAVLPSISMLPLLRTTHKASRSRPVIVFADPVFDDKDERVRGVQRARAASQSATLTASPGADSGLLRSAVEAGVIDGREVSLPRLPFTRREAEAILHVAPRGVAILDFDAKRRAVVSDDLTKYKIVHFATHGIINTDHPELSGLVLSLVDKQGKPQPGFVQAFELFNLNLDADLVVLSGCQTALGKEVRGEGLLGLTRAFMYAGAPRVVASLWKVDDVATAEMMSHFYGAMLGPKKLRPAAALRVAQNAMLRQDRWSHPYFWAGFVIQGDWE